MQVRRTRRTGVARTVHFGSGLSRCVGRTDAERGRVSVGTEFDGECRRGQERDFVIRLCGSAWHARRRLRGLVSGSGRVAHVILGKAARRAN